MLSWVCLVIDRRWRQIVIRTKKETQASVSVAFLAKYDEENLALLEHTCLTNREISLKLSPPIGITTSAFVWKPGISTPPTLV